MFMWFSENQNQKNNHNRTPGEKSLGFLFCKRGDKNDSIIQTHTTNNIKPIMKRRKLYEKFHV